MPPKKKAPPEEAPAPPVDAPKPTLTPSAQRRASAPYVFKEGQMNEMELMKEMVKMHATLNQIEYWMAIFEVGLEHRAVHIAVALPRRPTHSSLCCLHLRLLSCASCPPVTSPPSPPPQVAQEQYSMMHKFMFVLPGIGIGAFMSSGAFSSLFRGCGEMRPRHPATSLSQPSLDPQPRASNEGLLHHHERLPSNPKGFVALRVPPPWAPPWAPLCRILEPWVRETITTRSQAHFSPLSFMKPSPHAPMLTLPPSLTRALSSSCSWWLNTNKSVKR